MEDQLVRGEGFEKEAEKKLSGWGWGFLTLTNKYDDAADLFDKAAICYKLAKSWDKAGAAYVKLANCYLKDESKHDAALTYVDAAKCYKKISSQEAILCLDKAVGFFLDVGRLVMAARFCKEIGELYEQEENFERAIVFQERAADLFQSEEITIFANQSKQKVAQFAAQLERYSKAREIFEEIATHSINNSLLKYSVKEILLNAGLCQLCSGDFVAMKNTLRKYRDLDPTFSRTQEFKFLYRLAFAIDREDVTKFTRIVKKFSIMIKLDPWKTTLLLRAEHTLKEKVLEEDDLT